MADVRSLAPLLCLDLPSTRRLGKKNSWAKEEKGRSARSRAVRVTSNRKRCFLARRYNAIHAISRLPWLPGFLVTLSIFFCARGFSYFWKLLVHYSTRCTTRRSDPGDTGPFRTNCVTEKGNRGKKDEKRPKNPLIDVPRETTLLLFGNKRWRRERKAFLAQPSRRGSFVNYPGAKRRPGVL